MAPSAGGHLLVSKSLRLLRLGFDKAARLVRDKIPQATQPVESQTQPVYARVSTQPVNRVATIRQSQSRWFTTKARIDHSSRRLYSTANHASKPLRSSYPPSRTGRAVSQLTTRAPFASTLRPNLTGGALSRTSGGYNIGAGRVNGVRYFSHTPASPAEVVQNVSQAVRAFWLSGQKAHFNGYNPKTGEKRFRAVSSHQDKARQKLDASKPNAPGSFVDFKVSPTITAIGPLSMVPRSEVPSVCESEDAEEATITNANLLTTLEVDFARALKDLAAIMNDLKHLSTLGSLPLVLINNTTLRVRFPGCDADTVESLCKELNIRRGMVGQDADFDEHVGADVALLFPFAPSRTQSDFVESDQYGRPTKRSKRDHVEWQHMLSSHRTASSVFSKESALMGMDPLSDLDIVENPWLSSPSGYSSFHHSADDTSDDVAMFFRPPSAGRQYNSGAPQSDRGDDVLAYEGIQGIYRFLGECERAQR